MEKQRITVTTYRKDGQIFESYGLVQWGRIIFDTARVYIPRGGRLEIEAA